MFSHANNRHARSDRSHPAPAAEPRRRSGNRSLAIGIAVVVIGVLAVLYPYAADYLNRMEQAKVGDQQEQAVAELPQDDLSAEWKRARRYNRELLDGATYVVDPFDPDAPKATDEEYVSCLNVADDGIMGQIVIPEIGVDLPIYHGTDGDFMSSAAGHVVNTCLPVGGSGTHAVLAAHTGVPSAVLFDNLDRLQVGDYFVLQVLGKDLGYRIYDIETVLPDETESLAVQESRDLVTLVTCTPYGVNSHRLLVHAERCEVPDEFYSQESILPPQVTSMDPSMPPSLLQALIALAACVAVVYALVRALSRRRRRRS